MPKMPELERYHWHITSSGFRLGSPDVLNLPDPIKVERMAVSMWS